MSLKKLINRF